MKTYSKPRLLLLAMTDSISGEMVGESIDLLYKAGAKNVQVMNTITKKNRPGYTFLIDCDHDCVEAVETVLVSVVGTTGWHRIASKHCYTDVEYLTREIRLSFGSQTLSVTVSCKHAESVPVPYRIERECLTEISTQIETAFHIRISRPRLSAALVRMFTEPAVESIPLETLMPMTLAE